MKKLTIIILIVIIAAIGIWKINSENQEENLVGGCAGVYKDYQQECCDNWAKENNIIKIQCVGEWEIIDNKCSWKCLED